MPARNVAQSRLKELSPFTRYSREEIALLRSLVNERKIDLLREAHKGDIHCAAAAKNVKRLLVKLDDDLKMRA